MNTNTEKANTSKQQDEKWSWEEPTEEEFEKNCKVKTCYKIYFLDNDIQNTVYKFWADNNEAALGVLNDYKNDHQDEAKEFFYSTSGYYISHDRNRYDDMKDMMRHEKLGLIETIWDFLFITIPTKIFDVWWKIKNIFRYIRTGHSIGEYWSIYYHMLDDLKYNLPILIEKHVGYPSFIKDKVKKQFENGGDATKNDDEYSQLASKMWEDDLNNLLENVLLYEYYEGFGIISDNDKQMVEIDKKYRDTLPYKEGTNKELDYIKLHELSQVRWNNVWDWIKEKGQTLWD